MQYLQKIPQSVVILGAGHAGGTAAAQLRQNGFTGAITVVGAEPEPPYQRPPLSKAWLTGETSRAQIFLRPKAWYEGQDITLRLGVTAEVIDPEAREVTFEGGDRLSYDALVLATGAAPLMPRVSGVELDGIFPLRTVSDADRIRDALFEGVRVVCIGAGYIGLEIAASARKGGAVVAVVEREARSVSRVASAPLAAVLEARHRQEGVSFHFGTAVEAMLGEGGQVTGVQLSDGTRLEADAVVIGIGVVPEDGLARVAGLTCTDGIEVDEETRTSDPHIFAIGDVSHRPLPTHDRRGRLESVPNALEQARVLAAVLTGKPLPRCEAPWFWSDQYDLKVQIAGLPGPDDRLIIRGGEAAPFAAFHLDAEDRLTAVEAVNDVPSFMIGRKLITARTPCAGQTLSDPAVDLKALL